MIRQAWKRLVTELVVTIRTFRVLGRVRRELARVERRDHDAVYEAMLDGEMAATLAPFLPVSQAGLTHTITLMRIMSGRGRPSPREVAQFIADAHRLAESPDDHAFRKYIGVPK